jgi:isochorismate hydrolase
MQTALDLLERGLTVFVAADAVASRYAADHEVALRRLERAGAVLTTVETAVFEWVGTAGAPQFKAVSALVQERMRKLVRGE